MDRALIWFVRVWMGLAIAVNAIAVLGIFMGAHGFWDGWQRVAEIYGPYNVMNYLMELVLVSPAIGAYAWLQRRRKGKAKPPQSMSAEEVQQIIHAYGSAMAEPGVELRDVHAFPSKERIEQGLLRTMSVQEAQRSANEYGALIDRPGVLHDVGALPYPKDRIKQALLMSIALTPPGAAREHLRCGYVMLGDWQDMRASDPTAATLAEGKALLAELRSLGL
jgi:hypothetical protein